MTDPLKVVKENSLLLNSLSQKVDALTKRVEGLTKENKSLRDQLKKCVKEDGDGKSSKKPLQFKSVEEVAKAVDKLMIENRTLKARMTNCVKGTDAMYGKTLRELNDLRLSMDMKPECLEAIEEKIDNLRSLQEMHTRQINDLVSSNQCIVKKRKKQSDSDIFRDE